MCIRDRCTGDKIAENDVLLSWLKSISEIKGKNLKISSIFKTSSFSVSIYREIENE